MSKLSEFLAGERPEDVALFLADDYLDEDGTIASHGESVDGGVVLVADGEQGRSIFSAGTGMDAMQFAKGAMGNEGDIAADLAGGVCPASESVDANEADEDDADHAVQFVFAFAEEQNEEVGGLYAEGDVIHAYAHCDCGESFSHKWVTGER
ncbi:DUF5807 family protein [Salinirubrum litoreum]|uniref:DUF5807 family protein n=1 Tax=Salinirubrum litoreum TaxID=1126234 RepID=A0ABD5R777_9EURY|nr:DUF5807 family protein [Salinirubrum litoreum]